FVDPDRRSEGRRELSPSRYAPALEEVASRLPRGSAWAAKIAPGVPRTEIERSGAGAEVVSLEGELKECGLWFGCLCGRRWRATVLPSGSVLEADSPAPVQQTRPPLAYLYDPDPAVIRAGLVTDLAVMLGARQLDAEIAYLTSDRLELGAFARALPV